METEVSNRMDGEMLETSSEKGTTARIELIVEKIVLWRAEVKTKAAKQSKQHNEYISYAVSDNRGVDKENDRPLLARCRTMNNGRVTVQRATVAIQRKKEVFSRFYHNSYIAPSSTPSAPPPLQLHVARLQPTLIIYFPRNKTPSLHRNRRKSSFHILSIAHNGW